MRRALLSLLFIVITGCATKPDAAPSPNFVIEMMLPMAKECASVHGSCCIIVSLAFDDDTALHAPEINQQCERTFASHGLNVRCQLRPTDPGEMGTAMLGPMSDCVQ